MAAAHVILGDQLIRVLPHLFTADKAVVLELGLPVALEHHIVLQTIIQHQTMLVAVLRDMAHAVLGTLTDALVGDLLAVQQHLAAVELFQTGQTVDKLGLAVALNARQTDDLTATHLERDVLDGILLVLGVVHGNVLHVQHHLTGGGGLFVCLYTSKNELPSSQTSLF